MESKPYILEATRTAKQKMAERRGIQANVVKTGKNNFFSVSL